MSTVISTDIELITLSIQFKYNNWRKKNSFLLCVHGYWDLDSLLVHKHWENTKPRGLPNKILLGSCWMQDWKRQRQHKKLDIFCSVVFSTKPIEPILCNCTCSSHQAVTAHREDEWTQREKLTLLQPLLIQINESIWRGYRQEWNWGLLTRIIHFLYLQL